MIFNKLIWGVFSSLKKRFHQTKGDEVTSRLRQLDVPDIFRQEKEGKISFYSRQNMSFPPKIEIRGLGCADLRHEPRRLGAMPRGPRAAPARRTLPRQPGEHGAPAPELRARAAHAAPTCPRRSCAPALLTLRLRARATAFCFPMKSGLFCVSFRSLSASETRIPVHQHQQWK